MRRSARDRVGTTVSHPEEALAQTVVGPAAEQPASSTPNWSKPAIGLVDTGASGGAGAAGAAGEHLPQRVAAPLATWGISRPDRLSPEPERWDRPPRPPSSPIPKPPG
jgi:hypothetical protein